MECVYVCVRTYVSTNVTNPRMTLLPESLMENACTGTYVHIFLCVNEKMLELALKITLTNIYNAAAVTTM